MQQLEGPPPRGGATVLALAGALGFYLGYARFPDWQVPVETAQVLAGIVAYPHETPFYVYHLKLWTVLHQVCALALRAGASEIALSHVISGALGMLSLQALAMFTFAFSRRAVLATGAALLFFVSQVTDAGAVYPIFLMGVPFTYGVIGLGMIALIAALIGSGWHRTGAVLLGLVPAVHPSLGFWFWILVAVWVLVDGRLRATMRGAAAWFGAGLAVTLVSFAVHQWMSAGVPSTPVQTGRAYFDAFVGFWDGHRRPIRLTEIAVILNVAALAVSSAWLRWCRDDVSPSAQSLLRFVQVSAVVALALIPLSWIPPHRLPTTLLILMPGRVLNLNAFTFAPMVFGLLASSRRRWPRISMLLMAAGLLIARDSLLWRMVPTLRPAWIDALPAQWIVLAIAAVAVACVAMDHWRRRPSANEILPRARPGLALGSALGIAVVMVAATIVAFRAPEHRAHIFFDRTNNGVLATAARGEGLLLTAGDMHMVQLRTRRPQLIDTGALDTAAYMPATAPAMARILREVYGLDLFNPPPEARGGGRLPPAAHRQRWERYTPDEWRAISRRFDVTQVLTPYDWQLDLPIIAGDRRFLLYAIAK